MGDETTTEGKSGAPPRTPVVFVADASVEAGRVADTLRAAGYVVVEVPITMLLSRSSAQRPGVVLVDVDHDAAMTELGKLRKAPGSGSIDFIFFGTGEGTIRDADDALARDAAAFFLRPIDIAGLVRKIEALTGGPSLRPNVRPSTPPPSIPVRHLASSVPPERPSQPSLPAPGARVSMPMSTPSLSDLVETPRSLATFGTVSQELQQLLAEAEQRVAGSPSHEGVVVSPEDELEAVLPADVLASLDEPLDDIGADNQPLAMPETSPGKTRPPTTSGGRATRSGSDPPRTNPSTNPNASTSGSISPISPGPISPIASSMATPASMRPGTGESVRPPPVITESTAPKGMRIPSGTVLGPGDARKFLADAMAKRSTGALCFEHDGAVRRLVIRDGDLVTAASGVERESFVHFLGSRGELPREEVAKLAAKVPPYGRHAGAALVAHGWLRQDQLWPSLRSHCEWIATEVIRLNGGTAQLEAEPPGRLRSEPSVFGASTGPEIFVELVRRATPSEEALRLIGGENARIGVGPKAQLLAECNLTPPEVDLISRSRGATVGEILLRDGELGAALHALSLLGVIEIVPSIVDNDPRVNRRSDAPVAIQPADDLDEGAIRSRIRARIELVEEADYFALLGVARDATGYEVRRAFFELRRAFEPSRILTPRLVDLSNDVQKIVTVLEEAYEILRDPARRDRYRRAIEAKP